MRKTINCYLVVNVDDGSVRAVKTPPRLVRNEAGFAVSIEVETQAQTFHELKAQLVIPQAVVTAYEAAALG